MKIIYKDGHVDECPQDQELHVIRHTAAHIMAQAIKRLYPEADFAFGPATENGFYYDVDLGDTKLTDDDLANIEKEMRKICKENLAIKPFILPRDEAVKLMEERQEHYKIEHMADLADETEFSFFQQGEYVDMCIGPHLTYTKALKAFKITQQSGAYWKNDKENKMLTRAIENAQTTVESRNFQSRKSVLEYDDVMNKQREIIYAQRRQVLDGLDIKETVLNMMHTSVSNHVALAFGENQQLDAAQYHEMLKGMEGIYFAKGAVEFSDEEIPSKTQEDFDEAFIAAAEKTYEAKEQEVTTPIMRELERVIMLRVVDEYWMDHIDAMDDLKQGVRLQGYGNNNPVDVYKRESLEMFEEMVSAIQDETVRRLYSVRLRKDEEVKRERVAKATVENVGGDGTTPKKQPVKKTIKIGRNDPCPCGSGLKWKKCTCKEYHPDL